MDSETIKQLTDPFFTTKRDSGGTGLAVSLPGEFYFRAQAAYGGEGIQFTAAFNRGF